MVGCHSAVTSVLSCRAEARGCGPCTPGRQQGCAPMTTYAPSWPSPMRTYFCTECESTTVAVSEPVSAAASVVCGHCGHWICQWAEFIDGLRRSQAATQREQHHQGLMFPMLRI
jgi:hypothetical protein